MEYIKYIHFLLNFYSLCFNNSINYYWFVNKVNRGVDSVKKHVNKCKKVVIDAIDGKIINKPVALKLENVKEYVEKNGFKLIKILSLLVIVNAFYKGVYAYDISTALTLDLTTLPNIYMLISILLFSIILIILGYINSNFSLTAIGSILMLFIGLILLINGFNPILSMLICLISLILVWLVY